MGRVESDERSEKGGEEEDEGDPMGALTQLHNKQSTSFKRSRDVW
jgi:hypothetical protein